MRIEPTLELLCKLCGWRPDRSLTMADIKQHMIVAHHTDNVNLDLATICTCSREMRHTFTETTGDGFRDHFKCDEDGNEGWIERHK
jgi:hypothetical protein